MTIDLSQKEIRLLVQSLTNCLATCKVHQAKPDAPCEDCDAARVVQERLRKQIAS